ncbi:hypothetical protein ACQPZP_26800 [Spirillospora sp. CA-142024]|uniref:hypothetical protein n=1 Tax=Spirillospora sp. CA-142024 TaxID=3240036 RepID=UPI003D90916F
MLGAATFTIVRSSSAMNVPENTGTNASAPPARPLVVSTLDPFGRLATTTSRP